MFAIGIVYISAVGSGNGKQKRLRATHTPNTISPHILWSRYNISIALRITLIEISFYLCIPGIFFVCMWYALRNDRTFSASFIYAFKIVFFFTSFRDKSSENTLGNKVSRAIPCIPHFVHCFRNHITMRWVNVHGFVMFSSLCGHENGALTPNGLYFMITCVLHTPTEIYRPSRRCELKRQAAFGCMRREKMTEPRIDMSKNGFQHSILCLPRKMATLLRFSPLFSMRWKSKYDVGTQLHISFIFRQILELWLSFLLLFASFFVMHLVRFLWRYWYVRRHVSNYHKHIIILANPKTKPNSHCVAETNNQKKEKKSARHFPPWNHFDANVNERPTASNFVWPANSM